MVILSFPEVRTFPKSFHRFFELFGIVLINEQIVFGIVSKVHTNAFTDIDEKFYVSSEGTYTGKVNRYEATSSTYDVYDSWLTVEQITSISSVYYDFTAEDAIFEDGWFNGITVENENYETLMAFMSEVYVGTFTNYLSFQ